MKAAILIISDRGARGEREDKSGPALSSWLCARNVEVAALEMVPDEIPEISETLRKWADNGTAELLLTSGGTGVSPRDVTPEATMSIADRIIPGIGELMRMKSLLITPMASLSRAVGAVRKTTLIINLPGSPRGAVENLEAVWPVVSHAVEKICGDESDCAGTGRE